MKKKKEEKSVQINNLKWHSKWHSASPFPVTVSCSQTGLLYISANELVPGGKHYEADDCFVQHEGKWGVRMQRRVSAGRRRGAIGVCRLWPPTCNDHLMDVVSLRSNVCQRRTGKVEGNRVWRTVKKLKKTLNDLYLLTRVTPSGIRGVSVCDKLVVFDPPGMRTGWIFALSL